MATRTRPLAEVLLEQSRTVAAWLRSLDEEAFAAPSVLAGWDVRQLAGHLVFAHRTLRGVAEPHDGRATVAGSRLRRGLPAQRRPDCRRQPVRGGG